MLYRDYLKDKYQSTALKTAYAEGFPCVLESSKGKNIRNYEVYGNSVQDGTPTPESPVEIQSVGDLTVKNLLPYPYSDTTKTINGVTFTDNGDGSITANGTATADTRFYCRSASDKITISPGTYTMSGCPDGGNSTTYYIGGFAYNAFSFGQTFSVANTTSDWFYIMIKSGITVNNVVFKPQLEEGSTATEYEPYRKYDIPITVTGKNLIPYPYYHKSRTLNGITFAIYDDGTIILNGTGEFDTERIKDFILLRNSDISAGTYTLSGCPTGGGVYSYRLFVTVYNYYSDGSPRYYHDMGRGTSIDVKENCRITISIRFGDEIGTVNSLVFKPQLEKGSSATEYEPYKGRITEHIYLDEPLRKVGDYSDYVDFKKQKVVRNISEIIFDGTENWGYRDTDNIIYLSINNLASSVYCYSTHFLSEALKDTISPYFRPVTGVLRLYQRSNNIVYLSADEFKAFLQEQSAAGTSLVLDYVLSSPIEENVSLPALKTFKGTSVMSVDTSLQPSNIKAKYVKK